MDKINSKVFLKVTELGSFKRAADALGYTQAGVSYIISAMEETMGFRLFIREAGGVKLTREGMQVYPILARMENEERILEEMVNSIRHLQRGTIRVLTFNSVSVSWLPGIISAFSRDYPDIRIELVSCEKTTEAEEMVYSRDVDCGFFLLPVKKPLEVFPLACYPIMAALSRQHPLAEEARFPISDIGKYPYISLPYRTELSDIFDARDITPKISYITENDYSALAMAEKNLGYCIYPKLLLKNIPYDVVCLEFDEPIYWSIGIATRSLSTCPKAAVEFIRYARNWVA